MFFVARLIESILGTKITIEILTRLGAFGLAWELLDWKTLRAMRADISYCYTYEFGVEQAEKAELALAAKAYERAYINSTDAIAVLEWKGAQRENVYEKARVTRDQSMLSIAPERLEDLMQAQEKAHTEFLRRESHAFNARLARDHPFVHRQMARGLLRRVRIHDRLP